MKKSNHTRSFLSLTLGATLLFSSGCAAFRSDMDSSNPVIAAQAQRISDLRNQISDQDRLVETEKAKLKSLEYQLKSAQQELKARKM